MLYFFPGQPCHSLVYATIQQACAYGTDQFASMLCIFIYFVDIEHTKTLIELMLHVREN